MHSSWDLELERAQEGGLVGPNFPNAGRTGDVNLPQEDELLPGTDLGDHRHLIDSGKLVIELTGALKFTPK